MSKKHKRRSLWMMALSCVLDEQRRHKRELGHVPADELAKAYMSFAVTSQQIAQIIGQQDAEAAQEDE